MISPNWLEEVAHIAKKDAMYRFYAEEIKTLEPEFLTFLQSLPKNQRILVEDYLDACVSEEKIFSLFAYQVGMTHGKIEMQREFSRRNRQAEQVRKL